MADAGAGPAEPPQLPPDAPPPPAAAAAAATEPPPQPAGDGDAQPPLPGGEGDAQPPLPGQQEGGDGGAGRSGDDGGTAGPSGGDGGAPPLPEEDEEDPLVVAQREQEAAERAKQEAPEIPPYDEEALKVRRVCASLPCTAPHSPSAACVASSTLARPFLPPPRRMQEFYTDLKDAEREGEVQRILSAFKLNPYEQVLWGEGGMRQAAGGWPLHWHRAASGCLPLVWKCPGVSTINIHASLLSATRACSWGCTTMPRRRKCGGSTARCVAQVARSCCCS